MEKSLLDLQRRLRGPQRHRLLQGYPVPSLMRAFPRGMGYDLIEVDDSRPLLLGILPHAACNPTVRGCGYCTFPHEEFRVSEVRETVLAVLQELSLSPRTGRKVEAVYFGGGTANLTPPDLFSQLCQALARQFDVSRAEVTLEGAPVYFSSRREALLDVLQRDLEGSELRLSMGVQTFDPERIAAMGRQHIGSPESVEKAVVAARRRGMTTSADLLINLPGQSLQSMKSDVIRAGDLGFSQICLYHLVLFRGLGTPWARDQSKLAGLPDNARAFAHWTEARELILSMGYVQTSLTNFQREGHFRYEDCSYRPELYDWAGFGPEALSCYTDFDNFYAVKWMNEASGQDYRKAMLDEGDARARYFLYGEIDLRLLFLTRNLARLRACRKTYRDRYGSDLVGDFREPLQALESEGLVVWDSSELRLTQHGMFFADSVVGLLAAERVSQIRRGEILEEPPNLRMG